MKQIVFKLLKSSFFIVFGITLFVFFIIVAISSAITKYNNYLKTSFSNKQNHITIKYINKANKNDIQKIKTILKNRLVSYNTFTETLNTVEIRKGAFFYRGKVKIIGLGVDHYPITYDFNKFDIRLDSMYNVRLTGIELFEEFRNSNVEIFNKTLHKSFFNHAPSTLTTYKLKLGKSKIDINFEAILDDMKDESILFMNINKLNKLLHYKKGHIDGFYLNIKDPLKTHEVKEILLKNFRNIYVTTWQEANPKQSYILSVFGKIGRLIQFIVAILGIATIGIIFINQFIRKQAQLRVLNILGMELTLYINMVLVFIMVLAESFAILPFIHFIDKYVLLYFILIPIFVVFINNYFLSTKQNILR